MKLPELSTSIYETNLISTGEKVKYRPFKVKENKILLTMKDADAIEVSRILKELVDVCTFNKLKIEELPYFDIEFLFLQIRSKSIGEIVDVNVNCGCGNKIKTNYNIDDLVVEKHDNHTKKIDIDENCGLEMRYPSIDRAISLFDEDDENAMDELIYDSIQAIYTKDGEYWEVKNQDKKEVIEFVNSMEKEQFDKIENFFKTSPQIVQNIEAKCDKCENTITAQLRGLYNFFV